MPDAVRYAVAKRVAHIVLDRPPVNALSLDMIRAVIAALRQAAADDAKPLALVPGRYLAPAIGAVRSSH